MAKKNATCCSQECASIVRYREYIADWINGCVSGGNVDGSLSQYVRRHLFETCESKCSLCDWNKIHPITGKVPLQVDHINGDSTNHRPDNLRLICPSCHSLTTTYGSLNKGNGREARNIRRKMKFD